MGKSHKSANIYALDDNQASGNRPLTLRKSPMAIAILAVFILLVAFLAQVALVQIESQTRDSVVDGLSSILNTTREGIYLWKEQVTDDWAAVARSSAVVSATRTLVSLPPEAWLAARAQTDLRRIFSNILTARNDHVVTLIAPNRRTLASMWDQEVGNPHPMTRDNSENLDRIFKGKPVFVSPFMPIAPPDGSAPPGQAPPSPRPEEGKQGNAGNAPPPPGPGEQGGPSPPSSIMLIGMPVADENGVVLAALVVRLDPMKTLARLTSVGRFGETGETYFFDKQGRFATPSRFSDQLKGLGLLKGDEDEIFTLRVKDAGVDLTKSPLEEPLPNDRPLTFMADHALEGVSGSSSQGYRGYMGALVLGVWTWDTVLCLGMATEVAESEALEPYHQSRRVVLAVLGASVFLSLGLVILLSAVLRRAGKYRRLSGTDSLTGLANRLHFDRRLASQWKTSMRSGLPVSLIFVDIDFFKQYNDTYGHMAGDKCLGAVAHVLQHAARRTGDLAARWGGEEFAVLLPMADMTEAKIVADKIRLGVFGLKIPHKSSKIAAHVTISLGLATLRPRVDDDLSRLVQMADEALYRAKEAGRNRVETIRTDADLETV